MKKTHKTSEKRREHEDQRQRDANNKKSAGAPTSSRLHVALQNAKAGLAVVPLHGIKDGACTCGNPECRQRGSHPRSKGGLQYYDEKCSN